MHRASLSSLSLHPTSRQLLAIMSLPAASTALSAPTVVAPTNAPTFSSLSHLLDARLLRALSKLGFAHPTPVQSKLLPLALQGRDVLAQAPTGSGKTLAYALPAVQRVLAAKTVSRARHQAQRRIEN